MVLCIVSTIARYSEKKEKGFIKTSIFPFHQAATFCPVFALWKQYDNSVRFRFSGVASSSPSSLAVAVLFWSIPTDSWLRAWCEVRFSGISTGVEQPDAPENLIEYRKGVHVGDTCLVGFVEAHQSLHMIMPGNGCRGRRHQAMLSHLDFIEVSVGQLSVEAVDTRTRAVFVSGVRVSGVGVIPESGAF